MNMHSVLRHARVVFAVSLVSAWVHAAEPSEAAKLFDEGRAAFKANDFAKACPAFARSYELEPVLGTLLNWASCLEKQGAFTTAWLRFNDAIDWAQRTHEAEREQFAREHAKALRASVSWLALTASTELEVKVDGRAVRVSPTAISLPAEVGPHEVRAEMPGHEASVATVTITKAGETVTYAVPPLKKTLLEPPPMPVASSPAVDGPTVQSPPAAPAGVTLASSRGPSAAGISLVVVGSLALVGGVVGLVWSFSTYDLLQGQRVDAANPQPRVSVDEFNKLRWVPGLSWAGVAVGAAAISAGLVINAVSLSGTKYVAISPSFDASGAGVTVSGRF